MSVRGQAVGRSWRVALERVRAVDAPAAEVMEAYVYELRREAGRRRMEARDLRAALKGRVL